MAVFIGLLTAFAAAIPVSASSAEIRIGTTQSALLLWIAQEKGFFRSRGLDVGLQILTSGRHAADALLNDDLDISTGADVVFAAKAGESPDLRLFGSIGILQTARLVARGDRNIVKPGDLVGRRVGVTSATIGEYFLTRYLALNEVAGSPVIVDLKPAQIAQGLVNGTIDAGISWEPFITDAERALKGNAVLLPGQVDQIFFTVLLTKAGWAEKHGEQMRLLLKALIDAEKFASEEPALAKQLIKEKFGYAADEIEQIWQLHSLHISLPQALLFNLELQANWQIEKHLTKVTTVPRFLDLILTEPLADIRASSVEIIK